MSMKFQFDPNQTFQIDAINAIVDIFEGQRKNNSARNFAGDLFGIYPNFLNLPQDEILANVKKIQEKNQVKNGGVVQDLDFSVEMETGTGKTYVYLRTVFELNKKYGWKKFIVLVPSVAIREGVIKTLQITKEHFKGLYDNVPYRFYEYQSKNISQVRQFASSSNIEIMVMTVGAFNKDANVLYTERDQMQGEQPITFLQKTNPILILDEPQNMEGDATQERLKRFNSLFRLRYSATHKTLYNLMYQLAPYDAYQMGLVKKIEVFSVVDSDDAPSVYVNLVDVTNALKAKLEVTAIDAAGNVAKKKITVKQGDDLKDKTNNPAYEGFVVEALTANAPDFGSVGSIRFQNNITIKQGENVGGNRQEIMQRQIAETVRLHFEKKQKMAELGIKVLSLFFIDRVDNYIKADGFIRKTFIAEFDRQKKEFGFNALDVNAVHKGYFAMRGSEYLERESSIAENQEAYELIMKDKERLLSFDEPTEFIFSHSALKEGWDNPNVFNICTLNATASVMKKRQEIGRGMRLCVNQDGVRQFIRQINLLSVVANESYADYVSQLQTEFIEDGIYKAPPVPSNARSRVSVKLKKNFQKDENFKELWGRISQKTRYIVTVNSQKLIDGCAEQIAKLNTPKPQINIERVGLDITAEGIDARRLGSNSQKVSETSKLINCVDFIKEETKLTRNSVAEILSKANNFKSLVNNPDRFSFDASRIIKTALVKNYIEQIAYEITPETYPVDNFKDEDGYKDAVCEVANSIYDAIIYDSNVEKDFALKLNGDERIKLFIKLPNWFKVETPLGSYNPDWAIVTVKRDLQGRESNEKIYFVIETKGDIANLRPTEAGKIQSAKKHFEVIQVKYTEVDSYQKFEQECLT